MRSILAVCTCRIGRLRRLTTNQPHNVGVGDDNKAILQHAFNGTCCFGDFFRTVDDSHHDGHVTGNVEKALLVLVSLGAVSENASINRGAGDIQHPKSLYDRVIKRLAMPLVRLPNNSAGTLRTDPLTLRGEA